MPLLGIARRPPEHVAVQGGHELGQPRAPGGVEPGFERVLGRGLGRMELHDAALVQVEHSGEEANAEGLEEPARGAQAARFRGVPGGVARRGGGRHGRADRLARSQRSPHDPAEVHQGSDERQGQDAEHDVVANGGDEPQTLKPVERPVPLGEQPHPGAVGLGPVVFARREYGAERGAQRVRIGGLRREAHALAAATPRCWLRSSRSNASLRTRRS